MRIRRRLVGFAVGLSLLALAVGAAGCDTSFEPYAQADQYYSVFALLDATERRQWVRVEPLQDGRPRGADSTIEATVALERLPDGPQAVLEPRRAEYVEGFAHNFLAQMDLALGERYRLIVRRSDEKASTATVTMPQDVPALSLLGPRGLRAAIEGGTEDRLFFVNVTYDLLVDPEDPPAPAPPLEERPETLTAQYVGRATRTETGYAVSFDWTKDVRPPYEGTGSAVTLTGLSVEVALVSREAPDYEGRSYEELFRVGVAPSNVKNGYGLVAGVTSDSASVVIPPADRPPSIVP